jgi:hypothetical protein
MPRPILARRSSGTDRAAWDRVTIAVLFPAHIGWPTRKFFEVRFAVGPHRLVVFLVTPPFQVRLSCVMIECHKCRSVPDRFCGLCARTRCENRRGRPTLGGEAHLSLPGLPPLTTSHRHRRPLGAKHVVCRPARRCPSTPIAAAGTPASGGPEKRTHGARL